MPKSETTIPRAGAAGSLMAAGVLALLISCPAAAKPARIVWSTYLRVGPGQGFRVIDELRHDALIDLKSCDAQWCKVASGGIIGFIDKDAVALPRLPAGGLPNAAAGTCFITGQDAWRGQAKTRFCQVQPKS